VEKLLKELEQKATHFFRNPVKSLYFGGGTPSLLSPSNLKKIMISVRQLYPLAEDVELSIECNPDDLDTSRLANFRELGFNRLSIGIQSFREEDLKLMRRSHNVRQAEQAVREASKAGFDNITMDLIYGIPGQTSGMWRENIHKALSLPVNHISAYHLTYEAGTIFYLWKKKGRIVPVHEDESLEMYRILRSELCGAGYEHYEISNFAKEGKRSSHNQLYWSGEPYMGFGPSAHSFSGGTRSWNVASLKRYMESLQSGISYSETEELTEKERYHDYLIISLRTSDGADPRVIRDRFGVAVRDHFLRTAAKFLKEGLLFQREGKVVIDPEGWLMADHIMRELFLQ